MDKELQELDKARIGAIQNVEGFTGKGSSPDRTLTSSITVASTPQFWRGVMKSSLQHLSVCKTSIPELLQSMEKAIDGLRSRYGHILVCRDTKLALDGDEKMGNMVAHDVQDITKEDGEIIEAVEHLKAQEGSVNVVNADLPTSEDDTDTGYVSDLDSGFYSDIRHYVSACATPVKKPRVRVTSRMTITVNKIIRICDQLILTGPYGAAVQDHVKYDIIVLIRLGIGATPFISVIRDILHGLQLTVTREQSSFEWFIDVMKEILETTPRQVNPSR
ncbi:hypothetical protein GIB67_034012 [Kingdonia uniflora]|uniref:Ferric reductase NAD binding domain-containing protein n=1 Tax=Kingdonia uniflora TaxID=39325 RepID=A0A7J7M625_9MAGN|nr:hypothetical protein GIB67_034012 [Kingdonia uniflora]